MHNARRSGIAAEREYAHGAAAGVQSQERFILTREAQEGTHAAAGVSARSRRTIVETNSKIQPRDHQPWVWVLN